MLCCREEKFDIQLDEEGAEKISTVQVSGHPGWTRQPTSNGAVRCSTGSAGAQCINCTLVARITLYTEREPEREPEREKCPCRCPWCAVPLTCAYVSLLLCPLSLISLQEAADLIAAQIK